MEEKNKNLAKLLTKLAKLRMEFQTANIKKSGLNTYSKFNYFELGDIRPLLNKISFEIGIFDEFEQNSETAVLRVYDIETAEFLEFKMQTNLKTLEAKLKEDKQSLGMHPVQRLGGITTYLERYLLQKMLGLTEGEIVDTLDNRPNQQHTQKKQEADYRAELVKFCNEKAIDLKEIAEEHKLNKESKNADYKKVLDNLKILDTTLKLEI